MSTFRPEAPTLRRPRIMGQDWRRIAFVHWAVDPASVARFMPAGTRPDVLDGLTYVGLIPFSMERAGIGAGPPVPYLGDFPEWNVRLYSVDDAGNHGVVFLSLETSRLLVALGARLAFATPYTWARMRFETDGDVLTYRSRRRWPSPRGASSSMTVRVGDALPEPGAVEQFVTARFGLHTRWAGQTLWIPNHHEPWPLRRAELLSLDDDLLAAAGLPGLVGRAPDSVLFSDGLHTDFGRPQRV